MISTEITQINRRKLDLFEEFLAHLLNWYTEVNSSTYSIEHRQIKNDLSKLKVFKLHFFATSTNKEAIEIFDSFHALPYGHVETDIYSGLDELRHFELTNTELIPLDDFYQRVKGREGLASEMVNNLRKINPDIISYSAFDLVKLSHKWFSWKYNYSIAKENYSRSKKINPLTIINENKYYKLAF